MLDMYGNNFYFVPFFLFNFSMLLIMDHNPLVFFGWEGSQFGNSGGRPPVRLQSIGCRLVNTRPAKPLRGRGSKWSVFVWVYYYGIFFFFCKCSINWPGKAAGLWLSMEPWTPSGVAATWTNLLPSEWRWYFKKHSWCFRKCGWYIQWARTGPDKKWSFLILAEFLICRHLICIFIHGPLFLACTSGWLNLGTDSVLPYTKGIIKSESIFYVLVLCTV